MELLPYSSIVSINDWKYTISVGTKIKFLSWSLHLQKQYKKLENLIGLVKRVSIKKSLDKVGQEGCNCNKDSAINSDEWLQILENCTNKVKYAMVVPLKRRSRTFTEKGKEHQLKIPFEWRKSYIQALTYTTRINQEKGSSGGQ